MFYVYSKHLSKGRECYIDTYKTAQEAVHKIAQCYRIDAKSCAQDEYYYFMKQH